jgi:hypothetical protein
MSVLAQTNIDWFISAIVADGSVGTCLSQVIDELKRKEQFVAKLKEKLSERPGQSQDALTDLSNRLRILESTLKFRLSILSPERRGAWFRASASTATGPFAGTLLPEAIFSSYDETQTAKIRAALLECWQRKNLVAYPMRATETCLWKILLCINFELYTLGDLDRWPRIERMPDELPKDLEGRSIRAFLNNVRAEYLSVQSRLVNVYDLLLEASERFWAAAPRGNRVTRDRADDYDGHRAAESMRDGFRKRRAESPTPTIKRPIGKSAQDFEALKFMGFEDFPSSEDLKQRYHNMALRLHPDREGGSDVKFKLLSKSYKHLSRICAR